jgi:hypothetical protein
VIYDNSSFRWLLGLILQILRWQTLNHYLCHRLQEADKVHFWETLIDKLSSFIVNGSELTFAAVNIDSFGEGFSVQAILDNVVGRQGVPKTVPF